MRRIDTAIAFLVARTEQTKITILIGRLVTILRKGKRFRLVSRKGKNLGTFGTRAEAEKREKQVIFFKHKGE